MVELLRFYETEASIYLLLQHASGGKLWNYIIGYLHQHSDTQLDDVLDDVHERKLRKHKIKNDGSPKPTVNEMSTEPKNCETADAIVTFIPRVMESSNLESEPKNKTCNRQESNTEVDSLLDDNQSIDQLKQGTEVSRSLSMEGNTSFVKTDDDKDSEAFCDVLKATDISVKAFSINSFESDGGAASRMNSTTSDHFIESIPEAQCEGSSSHQPSDADVFKLTDTDQNQAGARNSHAQKDVCDMDEGQNSKTCSIIEGAQTAVEAANRSVDEKEEEFEDLSAIEDGLKLPEVPIEDLTPSNEEVSIYDLHKQTESESEGSSPERPMHLLLDKNCPSDGTTCNPKTSTPTGKSRQSGSTTSSPRDPERTPIIYRLPSQERSLESEVRPRKRNLSSVFRDLDLAEGEVKMTAHLPEVCVRQWAAEMVVAIGYLHSKGIVCK